MKRNHFFSAFALFGIAAALPLLAQETGSIEGLVTDPQNAAVPSVKIVIEQSGTNITRTTTTSTDGRYSFPSVASGTYSVTAEVAGFKKLIVPQVRV